MPTDDSPNSVNVMFANEIIDLANRRITAGESVDDVAIGIRQAAGNFSAYAFGRTGNPEDPNAIVDQFVQLLQYYLDLHLQSAQQSGDGKSTAAQNLESLIAQAKKELG